MGFWKSKSSIHNLHPLITNYDLFRVHYSLKGLQCIVSFYFYLIETCFCFANQVASAAVI
jgi:hypothetical protein